MNIDWLTATQKQDSLIIFCNGWGMDKEVVAQLDCTGFDVLTISAYDTLSCPQELIKTAQLYQKRYLIGWSMGVWMGAFFFSGFAGKKIAFTAVIAINGTLLPLDKKYGISREIFQKTYNNFNQEVRSDFYRQMCGKSYKDFFAASPKRSLTSQKKELLFFLKNICDREMMVSQKVIKLARMGSEKTSLDEAWCCGRYSSSTYSTVKYRPRPTTKYSEVFESPSDFYTSAIISKRDRIMLAKNQRRFWQEYGIKNIISYTGSHFIFNDLSSWQGIIHLAESCEKQK